MRKIEIRPSDHRTGRQSAARAFGTSTLLALAALLCKPLPVSAEHFALPGNESSAQAAGAPSLVLPSTNEGQGSFRHRIAIHAPVPFHGIEPRLALEYDSMRREGPMGAWALAGVSFIERRSPGKGAPLWNASDIFLLDGTELVPCGGQVVSPSCATGGTHATKIESYRRIQYVPAGAAPLGSRFSSTNTERWFVWAPNGTVWIYEPVLTTTGGVFRWGRTEVRDANDNAVQYTYACSGDCYLDNVAYSGVRIKLYYANRALHASSYLPVATGLGYVNSRKLLATVDVCVGDPLPTACATSNAPDPKRSRAYSLSWTMSGSTGVPLLTAVQEHGTDATLNSLGQVTGGTALPATTFSYRTSTSGGSESPWLYGAFDGFSYFRGVGDIDGDGHKEFIVIPKTGRGDSGYAYVSFYYPSPRTQLFTGGIGWLKNRSFAVFADVDADGKDEFVQLMDTNAGTCRRTAYDFDSDGTITLADNQTSTPNMHSLFVKNPDVFNGIGDITGDGMPELVTVFPNGQTYVDSPYLNAATVSSSGHGTNEAWERALVDITGDGRAELVQVLNDGRTLVTFFGADKRVSTTTSSNGHGSIPAILDAYEGFGDLNGDGAAEFISVRENGCTYVNFYRANGHVSRTVGSCGGHSGKPGVYGPGHAARALADVNGDGRVEYVNRYSWGTVVSYYRPDGRLHRAGKLGSGGYGGAGSYNVFADMNGDARADWITVHAGGWSYNNVAYFTPEADRLEVVRNGYGATITVAYAPLFSYTFPGHLNFDGIPNTWQRPPPILHVVTSIGAEDGRGWSATTRYEYANGYYDAEDRRFLGFGYVKTKHPCLAAEGTACPVTETWFRQDPASLGKPSKITRSVAGAAQPIEETYALHWTNGTQELPRRSLFIGSNSYAYDDSGQSRRRFMEDRCEVWNSDGTCGTPGYDAYGNVTYERDWGAVPYDGTNWTWGVARTKTAAFVANTAEYVVNRAEWEIVNQPGAPRSWTRYGYDGGSSGLAPTKGNLTGVWRAHDSAPPGTFYARAMEYDASGNLIGEVDEAGNRTAHTYDPTYHFLTSTITPMVTTDGGPQAFTKSYAWHPVCGVKEKVTGWNGEVTRIQHDPLCRTERTDFPGGKFENHTYCAPGSATNPCGDANTQHVRVERPPADGTAENQWEETYFDGLGRTWMTKRKGPAAGKEIIQQWTHNARGKLAKRTRPYYADESPAWTSFEYDGKDRLVLVTHPDGVASRLLVYTVPAASDPSTAVEMVTMYDELDHETKETFDALGRRLFQEERLGTALVTTGYAYDVHGNITGIIDDQGNQWTYNRNALGWLVTEDDPDRGTWTYEHNALGLMTASTDARGQRITYRYDELGRIVAKVPCELELDCESKTTWIYDRIRPGFVFNRGRLTTVIDSAGRDVYNYDIQGNVVDAARILADSTGAKVLFSFQKGYDESGRLRWVKYADGDELGTAGSPLGYDGAGRPASIPGIVTAATYTAWGAVASVTNANGTVHTRSYHPTRAWLTAMATQRNGEPSPLLSLDYSNRDAEGKIIGITSATANESWSYTYDDFHRLTSATNAGDPSLSQTLAYDSIGNIVYNSRVGPSPACAAAGENYCYPSSGLGSVRPHAVSAAGSNVYAYDENGNLLSGAGRSFAWDANNRLQAVDNVTFAYDARGARVQKSGGGGHTLYPGNPIGANVEASGCEMTKYISLGDLTIAKRVGTETFWLHVDHLGSVRKVTDGTGTEVQDKAYAPFGERLAASSSHLESLDFLGERQDESGMLYLSARYYDPVLARFVSADPSPPLGPGVGLNRYAYAHGDPVNFRDPSGLAEAPAQQVNFNVSSITLDLANPFRPTTPRLDVDMRLPAFEAPKPPPPRPPPVISSLSVGKSIADRAWTAVVYNFSDEKTQSLLSSTNRGAMYGRGFLDLSIEKDAALMDLSFGIALKPLNVMAKLANKDFAGAAVSLVPGGKPGIKLLKQAYRTGKALEGTRPNPGSGSFLGGWISDYETMFPGLFDTGPIQPATTTSQMCMGGGCDRL